MHETDPFKVKKKCKQHNLLLFFWFYNFGILPPAQISDLEIELKEFLSKIGIYFLSLELRNGSNCICTSRCSKKYKLQVIYSK